MKNLSFLWLVILLFASACQEQKPDDIIDKQTYKKIMHDVLLANVLKEELYRGEHQKLKIMPVIYKQYHIDSLQLAKSIAYYSKDPDFLVEIYQEIKDTYQKKVDSMEQKSPKAQPKKPKTDSIKVKKEVLKGFKGLELNLPKKNKRVK